MAEKHKVTCPTCKGSGALKDQDTKQIYACGACQGTGQQNRREVCPFDYVFDYTIPASGSLNIPVQILSWDFLLKWLVASTATPTDTVLVKDNNGMQWSNQALQIQNWAGSGELPFPVQPNWLQVKNTTITITVAGTSGHTGEIVLRGINLDDMPVAAAA